MKDYGLEYVYIVLFALGMFSATDVRLEAGSTWNDYLINVLLFG